MRLLNEEVSGLTRLLELLIAVRVIGLLRLRVTRWTSWVLVTRSATCATPRLLGHVARSATAHSHIPLSRLSRSKVIRQFRI